MHRAELGGGRGEGVILSLRFADTTDELVPAVGHDNADAEEVRSGSETAEGKVSLRWKEIRQPFCSSLARLKIHLALDRPSDSDSLNAIGRPIHPSHRVGGSLKLLIHPSRYSFAQIPQFR